MTVMKERFTERLKEYLDEDVGRWVVRVCDLVYKLRRLTISYRRSYEAGPVPVSAFKHTARWLAVAELQLTVMSGRNTGQGWKEG